MKSLTDGFKLANGVEIPCLGLGTWQTDGATTNAAIKAALQCGYRLIDTAAAYGNEASVGRAIAESNVPREELFITSKLRNACHGYEATLEAFEATINKIGVKYLDLYLIHWPNPLQFRANWKQSASDTWRAFEELYRAGLIRAIGVSNFMPHHIDELMRTSQIMPMVNQLKICPGVTQPETVAYCKGHGILVEAYSPFGTGAIFKADEMKSLAEKYSKTIGQVCLRWCLQMGFVPLPKSGSAERIAENAEIFDFELPDEDVRFISNLEGYCGEAPDPDNITF